MSNTNPNDTQFNVRQIYPYLHAYTHTYTSNQLGHHAASRNIRGGVTMSVPYDAVACGGKIDRPGFNKNVYAGSFLRTLKAKAEKQHKLFPEAFDIERIRACTTIGDFDDAFIASIYGFDDKIDYYRKCGSKSWIPKIRVPVISFNAVDDPFIEAKSLPDPVHGVTDPHWDGSHCGDSTMGTPGPGGGAPVKLVYHKKVGKVLGMSVILIYVWGVSTKQIANSPASFTDFIIISNAF